MFIHRFVLLVALSYWFFSFNSDLLYRIDVRKVHQGKDNLSEKIYLSDQYCTCVYKMFPKILSIYCFFIKQHQNNMIFVSCIQNEASISCCTDQSQSRDIFSHNLQRYNYIHTIIFIIYLIKNIFPHAYISLCVIPWYCRLKDNFLQYACDRNIKSTPFSVSDKKECQR